MSVRDFARRFWRLGRIWIALIGLHRQLRRHGFHVVFEEYVGHYTVSLPAAPAGGWEDEASEWLVLADRACRLVPWEAHCLHHSFLSYRFLRSELQIPIEIVIGVRKYPWHAHAWLVLGDQVISDDPASLKGLAVILHSGRWRRCDGLPGSTTRETAAER